MLCYKEAERIEHELRGSCFVGYLSGCYVYESDGIVARIAAAECGDGCTS